MDATATIVAVNGFTKRYRRRLAVDGAELSVRQGEIHGLIGPDGAGKSSLMKAVAGVLSFDAGEVRAFGTALDSERAAESVKDRIGFMPQGLGHNLYPELSVEENIDFFARLRLLADATVSERKERLLAMTRLGRFRTRAMKHLSGGMKQKLALICTLIHQPALLILDEPTTGVDPVSRRDFWEIIAELMQTGGMSALISTAYLDEASRFDRVTLMYAGRVLAQGAPDEIVARVPGTVVSLQAADQVSALQALRARFPQSQAVGSTLRVFVNEPSAEVALRQVSAVLTQSAATGLTASAPELEDTFVALLQSARPPEAAVRLDGLVTPALPTPQAAPAIEAIGLTKAFGAFIAAQDVSFRVPRGGIFGLLGANGAGKTTVIKMLTGILAPTRGAARVGGVDVRTGARSLKQHIGYVSQAFSLYTELSVVENMRLYAGIYGLDRRQAQQRLQSVLGMTALSGHEHERAESLPMGLRQRLALGCALLHQPQVLFLDEPTAGVDAVGRRLLWEMLFHLSREQAVTVLVTTHYMSEAEHCDELALMYAGRIVATGSPAQMKQDVQNDTGQILEVTVDDPRRAVGALRAAGCAAASLFGPHVHLFTKEPERDQQRVRSILQSAGFAACTSVCRPVSMEDVFVSRITGLERAAASNEATGARAPQSKGVSA